MNRNPYRPCRPLFAPRSPIERPHTTNQTRISAADADRIAELADEIRQNTFATLDNDPDLGTIDSAQIAARVERLVRNELRRLFAVSTTEL